MGLVGAFIGIAIMLGIGVQILANSSQDCSTLPGFNVQNSTGDAGGINVTADGTLDVSIGWALQCEANNTSTQNAYSLVVIILVVVAAVAILSVVRML